MSYKVLIGLPTYDNRVDARQALFLYGARHDSVQTDVQTRSLSALCWCFNHFWANALNDKTYDFFLLMHADIVPTAPTRWLVKLIAEADAARADLLSVLSPIKNGDGITSTGLISTEHPVERRLTTTEAAKLPPTFKAEHLTKLFGWEADTNTRLLVNTGCMLVDLRRNREKWETMHFQTHDDVVKVNGKWTATFVPEDWDFSMQAHDKGLAVAATKAITLVHNGNIDYRNDVVWGKESDV